MMKYSTYQSIFSLNLKNEQDFYSGKGERFGRMISNTLLPKLLILVIVAWIAGAGVLTVFAAPSASNEAVTKLVVQPGDTLWQIASKHKPERMDTRVYIEGIVRVNGLRDQGVQAGQVLKLPNFCSVRRLELVGERDAGTLTSSFLHVKVYYIFAYMEGTEFGYRQLGTAHQ
jgi:LysM repeat protein